MRGVEHGAGDTRVPGVAADLRRVLRWMIERSSDIEGGTPWIALRVFAEEGAAGYELPWFGTARAATGEVESTLFEGAVADLGASFQVSGLRARLELPRAWGAPAPVVSGIRPRVPKRARAPRATSPCDPTATRHATAATWSARCSTSRCAASGRGAGRFATPSTSGSAP